MDFDGSYSVALKKKKAILEAQERSRLGQEKEIRHQEDLVRRFKQHGTEKTGETCCQSGKKSWPKWTPEKKDIQRRFYPQFSFRFKIPAVAMF